MMIRIDPELPIAIYDQIAGEIRRLIFEGQIKVGDKLPPVRQVANDLGVNFNTVAQAYRLLEELQLIKIKRGSGATVTSTHLPVELEPLLTEQLRRTLIDWYLLGYSEDQIKERVDTLHEKLLQDRGARKEQTP